MKYTRPNIGDNTISYKGRRYWAIELAQDGELDFVTKELGNYVFWGCLYNDVIATIKDTKEGGGIGTIMSHVDLSSSFNSIEVAAKFLPAQYESYQNYVR